MVGKRLTADCELFDSIDHVPPELWEVARGEEPSVFTSPVFLRAVEGGLPAHARVFHAIVSDDGRPAACASLCAMTIDLLLLAGADTHRSVGWGRRLFPGLGMVKVLFCGLPVSAGQGHLGFAAGADRARAVDRLDGLLRVLARRERARVVVYKEFGEGDAPHLDRLLERGYFRAESPATYELTHPFPDFAAYCAGLKSHYRNDVRRSQRKFDRVGCRAVHLVDPQDLLRAYTPEVHRLYEAVVAKSEVKLEVLPVGFFHQLVEQFPGRLSLTTVYHQDRIVAFNWGLAALPAYHFLFCGIDYALNGEADLYFNLMYHQLDHALRAGARVVRFGQTADAFKTRVGCVGRPLHFYARAPGAVLSWVLRRFGGALFPPRPVLPPNDVFKAAPIGPVKLKA